MVGAGVCIAVAGFGLLIVVLTVLVAVAALVIVDYTVQHVVNLHQSDESVIHIDVKGKVMPLIASNKNNTYIETAHILERTAVFLAAGYKSIIIVSSLRHTRGHLAVPETAENAHIDCRTQKHIQIIAGGQLRYFPFESCNNRNLCIPVVVEALTY